MNDYDCVLSNEQYDKLNEAYSASLHEKTSGILIDIESFIHTLEQNGFGLPRKLQAEILSHLTHAKQILNLLHDQPFHKTELFETNPFHLIALLTELSIKLNSHTLKSAYQILFIKTNNIILECIKIISAHFSNKTLKIFKYM